MLNAWFYRQSHKVCFDQFGHFQLLPVQLVKTAIFQLCSSLDLGALRHPSTLLKIGLPRVDTRPDSETLQCTPALQRCRASSKPFKSIVKIDSWRDALQPCRAARPTESSDPATPSSRIHLKIVCNFNVHMYERIKRCKYDKMKLLSHREMQFFALNSYLPGCVLLAHGSQFSSHDASQLSSL